MTRLLSMVAAAAVASTLCSPAQAQGIDVAGMQQGLNMLEAKVARIFAQFGINGDPQSLDLSQIAEIVSRVDSGDETPSRSDIEFIVNRE